MSLHPADAGGSPASVPHGEESPGANHDPVGTDQAVEIVSRGTPIGTLRGAEGTISAYNGVVYVQVTDLAASCRKSKELGGTIPPGFPFDLPDGTGAIALVIDPTGHPVGMYSRTPLASGAAPAR